ncbi:MAG TPA: potassium channel family protein [Jiangellaceae bacterium]
MSDASPDPSATGDDGGRAATSHRDGGWARSTARGTIGAVVLVGAFYAFPDTSADDGVLQRAVLFVLCLVGLGALIVYLIRRAQANGEDVRIDTLVLTLLAAIVVFAQTYYALAQSPGQMDGLVTRTDALYFTITALSTIGFGDVHAAGQAARVVVIVQVLFTVIFVGAATTTIRRVVHRRGQRLIDRHRTPPTP